MRFALVVKNKEGEEREVIPKGVMESINKVLDSYGFEIKSVIPESMMGFKLRSVIELAEKAKKG